VITQLRLAWRLQRWELAFVVAGSLSLSALAFWQAADMRSLLTGCGTPAAAPACGLIFPFQESHGQPVQMIQMAIDFVPFVLGLIVGVPVVAREVEQRTALIAWPLAGSRLRWLAWRLAPPLVVALASVAVLAVAADQMAHAYFPNSDLGFVEYGSRGLPLVMRTALMLLSGVAVGALLGRVLPGLLLGIAVSVAVAVALQGALPHWASSTELSFADSPMSNIGSITTEVRFRAPDGRLIDAQAAEEIINAAFAASPDGEPDPSILPQEVFYGIAASRYPEVLLRESAGLRVAAIGLGLLAAFAVARRRPE